MSATSHSLHKPSPDCLCLSHPLGNPCTPPRPWNSRNSRESTACRRCSPRRPGHASPARTPGKRLRRGTPFLADTRCNCRRRCPPCSTSTPLLLGRWSSPSCGRCRTRRARRGLRRTEGKKNTKNRYCCRRLAEPSTQRWVVCIERRTAAPTLLYFG